MSSLIARGKEAAADFNCLPLALVPEERSWLHQRIAQRFDLMLQQDFLGEVRRLRQDYPTLTPDLPSMRCVGYRQAWDYLDGLQRGGIHRTRRGRHPPVVQAPADLDAQPAGAAGQRAARRPD
jgi:tRNA A37 N6-isopentenylltransferase MiaA